MKIQALNEFNLVTMKLAVQQTIIFLGICLIIGFVFLIIEMVKTDNPNNYWTKIDTLGMSSSEFPVQNVVRYNYSCPVVDRKVLKDVEYDTYNSCTYQSYDFVYRDSDNNTYVKHVKRCDTEFDTFSGTVNPGKAYESIPLSTDSSHKWRFRGPLFAYYNSDPSIIIAGKFGYEYNEDSTSYYYGLEKYCGLETSYKSTKIESRSKSLSGTQYIAIDVDIPMYLEVICGIMVAIVLIAIMASIRYYSSR